MNHHGRVRCPARRWKELPARARAPLGLGTAPGDGTGLVEDGGGRSAGEGEDDLRDHFVWAGG